MGNPEVKDLFFKTRFVGGWNLIAVLLYAPVGLLLALVRVFISLQAYLLTVLFLFLELPVIRKYVLRVMSFVLGMFIIEENSSQRDKNVRVLVANHTTILDHIPVHVLTQCFSPSTYDFWPLCLKMFGGSRDKHLLVLNLRTHLHKTTSPVLLLPEETTTNGKVGLLKFSAWSSTIALSVQPICIQVWRPLGITTSTINATFSTDLFWFLFCPVTVFRIKYLPVIERRDNESDEEMAERIAQSIAKEMGIVNTKFTYKDKMEYEKRLRHMKPNLPTSKTNRVSYELQRMAAQVGEVLPNVPNDVIVRDLSKTRSVDVTISNILEGTIKFTPITPEHSAGTSKPSASPSEPSCSFPRSAHERMISFAERKTKLIEDARRRYMEKHNLDK